ncbi:DUF3611 family protein [Synechocystis sp. PCC 7339]|uniref:DUF3611 family protein n=1 Tax=Synechocystis TaxID=1142 RepID=UPI00188058B6|nr:MULTISPECIES: DUF3611 family protein [Synechocystis]MBE9203767.1 DUF3611 family protein [Synechocystis salina LEGE 06099]QUS61629.1 DUF3611 family protein [Synechocystis sp. PCC 7338]UAJ73826.1 DUF3611 family protein [Synechocystis sp. PCC 7339]
MNRRNTELANPIPQAALRASVDLTTWGNIGFWVQIVLGAFSVVTFLFAGFSLSGPNRTTGIEAGILSAFISIVLLGFGIFFSTRYRRLGRNLKDSEATKHPRRADIIKLIRIGLIINLVGMGTAIIGGAAMSGIVLGKALSVPPGTFASAADPNRFVQSTDLLAIQANINTIIAHFTGLLSSLWLLDRLNK